MGKTSTVTDCEWEFIGEGYDPAGADELCADDESRRSDEEREKWDEEKSWEYWFG
jgi:hypothetical protein